SFPLIPPPPSSTLFPYTTLFRSRNMKRLLKLRLPVQPRAAGCPPFSPLQRLTSATFITLTPTHSGLASKRLQEISVRCFRASRRSEEHTSELQSRFDLVCRLLLE